MDMPSEDVRPRDQGTKIVLERLAGFSTSFSVVAFSRLDSLSPSVTTLPKLSARRKSKVEGLPAMILLGRLSTPLLASTTSARQHIV